MEPRKDYCDNTSFQYADISLPVSISPHAVVGEIETKCCGKPDISCREACSCGTCEITITQRISIKIPIRYSASICAGEPVISCCPPHSETAAALPVRKL